jgi:hypothetical protein
VVFRRAGAFRVVFLARLVVFLRAAVFFTGMMTSLSFYRFRALVFRRAVVFFARVAVFFRAAVFFTGMMTSLSSACAPWSSAVRSSSSPCSWSSSVRLSS